MVEISAHHVHVTQEHLEILFGKGAKLTNKKDLSQPGQFACFEKVDIVGPKSTIKNVSILGPTRPQTQVEISLTEARKLGVQAPIRMSGDIKDSAACTLVGPEGQVEISEGVIAAARHIHLDPKTAEEINVKDGDTIAINIEEGTRPLIFKNIIARVSEKFSPAVHLDTDEANAAALSCAVDAEIIVG